MFKIFCDAKVNDSSISKAVLATYRFGNAVMFIKTPIIKQLLWFTYRFFDLLFVKIIANADIPAQCTIGSNLYLAHGANGIVIHPRTLIGKNVRIYHQVTIGSGGTGNGTAPTIGDNVFIGVGAKILGDMIIGNNARIGTSAVVLKDVPNNATALGIPAKIY